MSLRNGSFTSSTRPTNNNKNSSDRDSIPLSAKLTIYGGTDINRDKAMRKAQYEKRIASRDKDKLQYAMRLKGKTFSNPNQKKLVSKYAPHSGLCVDHLPREVCSRITELVKEMNGTEHVEYFNVNGYYKVWQFYCLCKHVSVVTTVLFLWLFFGTNSRFWLFALGYFNYRLAAECKGAYIVLASLGRGNPPWMPIPFFMLKPGNSPLKYHIRAHSSFGPPVDLEKLLENTEFVPQSGTIIQDFPRRFRDADVMGLLTENVVVFIERTVAALVALRTSTNTANGVSVVLLYASTLMESSMYTKLENIVSGVLYEEYTPQTGVTDNVLGVMAKASESWKILRGHPMAEKICLVVTALVSAGICSASSFDWSYGNVQLFSTKMTPKFVNAGDVIEAILEVTYSIVATGAKCITDRSFRPLFPFLDGKGIDERYLKLTQASNYSDIGRMEEFTDFVEQSFLEECSEIMKDLRQAKSTSNNPAYQEVLERKVLAVGKMESDFKAKVQAENFRKQPYSILVTGDSGIGKSSIVNTLMQVCLRVYGHDYDPNMVCTLDGNDKFQSTYKSNQPGIIIDDLCNTKATFVQETPLRPIIDIVNNVVMTARKAEAHEKGKTPVRVDVLAVTTNVADVMASTYSNEPVSILRRWMAHITPVVRPGFRKHTDGGEETHALDSAKVVELVGTMDEDGNVIQIPDVWTFDVHEWVLLDHIPVRKYLRDAHGEEMRGIDFFELIRFVRQQCMEHKMVQEKLMLNYRDSALRFCRCGLPNQVCKKATVMCQEEMESHVGSVAYAQTLLAPCIPLLSDESVRRLLDAHDEWQPNVLACAIAAQMSRHHIPDWFQGLCVGFISPSTGSDRFSKDVAVLVIVVGLMLISRWFILLFPLVLYAQAFVYTARKRRLIEMAERDPYHLIWVMEHARAVLPALLGIAGGGLFLLRTIKMIRTVKMLPQGALNPENELQVKSRLTEVNPWAVTQLAQLPGTQKQKAQTHEESIARVGRHVVQMVYNPSNGINDTFPEDGSYTYCVTGLIIGSGLLLTPNHMWHPNADPANPHHEELLCQFVVHDKMANGGCYKVRLSYKNSVKLGELDLRLVRCTKIGCYQDIVWMFPEEPLCSNTQATFVTRERDGSQVFGNAALTPQTVRYKYHQNGQHGVGVATDFPTSPGHCISPYITKDRKHVIGALHIAGITGRMVAAGLCVTQKDLKDAMAELAREQPNHVLVSEGPFLEPQYGQKMVVHQRQHERCPSNYMPVGSRFALYGVVDAGSTFRSDVELSPISTLVAATTGWENQHGPPKVLSNSRAYRPYMLEATTDRTGPCFSVLEKASADYCAPLHVVIAEKAYIRDGIRPLNNLETICGIDGRRFIDPMNRGSSMGLPLNSPKKDFLIDLPPEDHPTHNHPQDFPPDVHIEVERMRAAYMNGTTCNPVFNSKIKDEPTKLSKDKVRIFHVTQIAFSYLIRQYFLTIIGFLSTFPLLSECAVGINAEGMEWDELVRHVTGFGEDRMLGVDYKGYDNSLNVDLIQAALVQMIGFAQASGNYTRDDLAIMRGIATDLLFPCVVVNGTLLRLCGTNTSGNNLTTTINSMCNSLLFRCAYFSKVGINGDEVFRNDVRLMTYGDDAIGSSSPSSNFDMVCLQEFCSTCDITVTMSDKSSQMRRYVTFKELDFLKRTSRFCLDRGAIVSCLDLTSVAKMLHIVRKKSALSLEEQMATNLATANRILCYYPRETYDHYNECLKIISLSSGLVVPELNKTYDQHVREWQFKYAEFSDTSSLTSEVTTFSSTEARGKYDVWDDDSPNEYGEI